MAFYTKNYDIVVVGAGHAGCEAALAAARMGCSVLMMAIDLDKCTGCGTCVDKCPVSYRPDFKRNSEGTAEADVAGREEMKGRDGKGGHTEGTFDRRYRYR